MMLTNGRLFVVMVATFKTPYATSFAVQAQGGISARGVEKGKLKDADVTQATLHALEKGLGLIAPRLEESDTLMMVLKDPISPTFFDAKRGKVALEKSKSAVQPIRTMLAQFTLKGVDTVLIEGMDGDGAQFASEMKTLSGTAEMASVF